MTIEQEYLEKYINPRIRKLFEQANGKFYISPGNQAPRFLFEHNDMLDFVELIAQECISVMKSTVDESIDFERKLDETSSWIESDIKKHFGVAESSAQAEQEAAAFIAAEDKKVASRYGYFPKLHPSEWKD